MRSTVADWEGSPNEGALRGHAYRGLVVHSFSGGVDEDVAADEELREEDAKRQQILADNATLLDTLVGLARLQVHEGRGFPAPSSAGGEQQSVATPHRT